MAPQPHLQASASAARQTHGQNDHGASYELKLHPHHREWNMQQVMTPQKHVPQESVLAPLLHNIYTYNLPTSVLQIYAYTEYFSFMHSAGHWQVVKRALSQDLVTLSAYLKTWWLKLSWSKTVSAAFHLNNKEIGHMLFLTENTYPPPRYQHTWV